MPSGFPSSLEKRKTMREKVWTVLYFGISISILLILPYLSNDKLFFFDPVVFIGLIGICVGLIGIRLTLGVLIYDYYFKFSYALLSDIFAILIIIAILLEVICIYFIKSPS